MQYRNGHEAKNGDKIVSLGGSADPINAIGILFDADSCSGNGRIASTVGGPVQVVCLCDCLHVDFLTKLLKQAGLDKRPAGK